MGCESGTDRLVVIQTRRAGVRFLIALAVAHLLAADRQPPRRTARACSRPAAAATALIRSIKDCPVPISQA